MIVVVFVFPSYLFFTFVQEAGVRLEKSLPDGLDRVAWKVFRVQDVEVDMRGGISRSIFARMTVVDTIEGDGRLIGQLKW